MGISKTVRFEVFKRDSFHCQYCGKTPPEVTLEVDHIQPKAKAGKDDINNLVTACFACNRGKRDISLRAIPSTLSQNLEVLKEKEIQLREYSRFIQKIEKRLQEEISQVDSVYQLNFPGWRLDDQFKSTSVKNFLRHLPLSEVIEAMENSCQRMLDRYPHSSRAGDEAIRYFCGYCWRKIKGDSRG
ncbi:MAG: HNH endonuclease [Acidobacteria bacterium]|nr:HNH endonuclease [Acidobacteriota bacterium]